MAHFNRMRLRIALFISLLLTSLVLPAPDALAQAGGNPPKVLILGDSLLAANKISGNAVGNALAGLLDADVTDNSVVGASFFHALPLTGAIGLRIPAQFRKGDWDLIVVNGGGNDIMFGCGCGKCDRMVNRLIGEEGTSGAIPELVAKLQQTGAKIVFIGYLRSPGFDSPVEGCGPIGDEMDRRLARMDKAMKDVTFLAMSDLVPEGDRSFHGLDLVHPSAKGSAAIAARIARAIQ